MSAGTYAPRAQVRIAGVTLAADVSDRLISVSYDSNADMADMFTLTLSNGDGELTDSPLFALGKSVEISIGYGDRLEPMMVGEVTSMQPAFPQGGAPTLTVTGYDRSWRLRHNDPSRDLWQGVNDSAIASEVAVLAGLVPVVDPSPIYHEEIAQTASDMAFLKERARANLFECYVRGDRLYFRWPRPQTEAPVLEWGENLSSFSPRLSAANAEGIRVVRGYNRRLAETVIGLATVEDLDLDDVVERLGQDALDTLVSLGRQAVAARGKPREERAQSTPVETPADAFALAKSVLQDALDGLYEASGSCVGMPSLQTGLMISVRGVGRRFSGRYRLKRVTHTLDGSGFRTTFEATQRSGASMLGTLRRTLTEKPSPDGQPPSYGLRVGKVKKTVDDQGLGRVKVSFPAESDKGESAWARVAAPMAGSERGVFFPPIEGDEVIVGFEEASHTLPIVLGGIWHGRARPPERNADGLGRVRLIKTGKHEIRLDDTDQSEQVVVKHSSGATITLRSDGTIALEAKKDLELKASGDVRVNGKNVEVTVAAGTGVMNVKRGS